MKVKDLIEKLQQFHPEAYVNCYAGYDLEFGEQWQELKEVEHEITDFTGPKRTEYWHEYKPVYEVFLK